VAKGSEYVSGDQQMINNLIAQNNKVVADTVQAVEMTCIDVMNHAKAGHKGNSAHMNQRYRNRTGNLTASIGPPEMLEISFERVHGIIPAGMEYAWYVEMGTKINVRTGGPNRPYPYMTPALFASREAFADRLKNVIR